MSVGVIMEERPLAHQQLLRLNDEAAALDTEVKAAVGEIKAAKAEGDEAGITLHRAIYDNLVARERELNAMRAALTTQLAGWSVVELPVTYRIRPAGVPISCPLACLLCRPLVSSAWPRGGG